MPRGGCDDIEKVTAPNGEEYVIEELLGSGTYACTYKAVRKSDGVNVALKTMNIKRLDEDDIDTDSIHYEVDIFKRLSNYPECSEYVACYYDSFNTTIKKDPYVVIVTEYVQGNTLDDLIDNNERVEDKDELNDARRWDYTIQLIKGLIYIHSKGVVHQDIKENNIIVDSKTKRVKYIDFGLSCMKKDIHDDKCFSSSASVYYRDPQTILADKYNVIREFPVREQSDEWSLGVVLYIMWNEGRVPVGEDTPFEGVIKEILSFSLTPSSSGNSKIDTALNSMILVPGVKDFNIDVPKKYEMFKAPPYRSTLQEVLEYLSTSSEASLEQPGIHSSQFYSYVNSEWSKYKIPPILSDTTVKDLCSFTSFDLKEQQLFIADFLSPQTNYERLLVYHGLGSGKTCGAISIAERWTGNTRVIVIVPASLEGNFRNELRSECVDKNLSKNPYLSKSDRKKLAKLKPSSREYKSIIRDSNKKIDKYYDIMSYERFTKRSKNNEIEFKNNVVIVDEIQNMVSTSGSRYQELLRRVSIDPPKRLVLLSATPIFDSPVEMALTMNIILPVDNRFIIKDKNPNVTFEGKYLTRNIITKQYEIKNRDDLQNRLRGLISYYRGANPKAYPKKIDKRVECVMSPFQSVPYLQTLPSDLNEATVQSGKNFFYVTSRAAANIVYPNGETGEKGFKSAIKGMYKKGTIGRYSCKLEKMLDIVESVNGPIFIYSNFVEHSGVQQILNVLKANGFHEYGSSKKGPKVAIFSGKETQEYRNLVVREYNLNANRDGSLIKVVIGSPAIKEGVTLKRTRAVIMFDPYWNQSRMDQIIGRAIRYCSHADLPDSEQSVTVYSLVAVTKESLQSKYDGPPMIDDLLYRMSERKKRLNELFETVMKEVAVDCELFKNANQPPNYECYTPTTNFSPVSNELILGINTELGKPSMEIRFSINKENILNKANLPLLVNFIKERLKKPPPHKFRLLVAYNKKRETEELAKRRLEIVLNLFGDQRDVLERMYSISIVPMSRGFIRFMEPKKPKSGKDESGAKGKRGLVIPGCPKDRRFNEKGDCPENYPYIAINSKGFPCCFSRRTKDKAKPNNETVEAFVKEYREKHPEGEVVKKARAKRVRPKVGKVEIKKGRLYIGRKLCTGYKMDELKGIIGKNNLPQVKGRKNKLCDHIHKHLNNKQVKL